MQQEPMYPYNENAEQAVLACILQYGDVAMSEVADRLKPDDFYVASRRHPEIYRAMCQLYEHGERINSVSVDQIMGGDGPLFHYLTVLSSPERVCFLNDAPEFAAIILNEAKRSQLAQAGQRIFEDAMHDKDASAVLARAEQALLDISQQGRRGEWQSLVDISTDYLDHFTSLEQQKGEVSGLRTGFYELDFLLGGLQRQDMDIIAGRPGSGKTSFALSIAYHVAFKEQKNVAFFSLEMSKQELFGRLVSMRASVDGRALRTPWQLDYDARARVHQAIADLEYPRIFVDDSQALSTIEMRSRAKRLSAQHGLDLIIVDYLQLMRAYDDKGKRYSNRQQEISEVSMALKGLSKELDVPVIALAQLNREVESRQSKVPQLSDLRESGQIEQDSDVVMFIYRDEMYNPDTERTAQADIVIAKHRDGPTGEVVLHFEAALTRFKNIERRLEVVR